MPVSTTDVVIADTQGWVLVATNPAYLLITPHAKRTWFVAVTPGTVPATDLVGALMRGIEDRFTFESGPVTGTVYVRVSAPVDSTGRGMRFGVITA